MQRMIRNTHWSLKNASTKCKIPTFAETAVILLLEILSRIGTWIWLRQITIVCLFVWKMKNAGQWKAMSIELNTVTNGLDRISAGSWVESTQLTKSWLDFSIRRLPLPAPFPLLSHGDPGISLIKDETLGYPTARPWNASRMCTLLTLLSMNCSKHTNIYVMYLNRYVQYSFLDHCTNYFFLCKIVQYLWVFILG